jgi:putative heme-binding domain-containing protein
VGYPVGPDLAALSNKSPQYLLAEILDPSKNVDTRYVEYAATTKAGRVFSGLLAAETATSITLRGQEGKEQVLLRSELEEFQSTGKSLMPEGMEKDLSKQDFADLIAYLGSGLSPEKPAEPDAADLARQILDDKQPAAQRQALVERHPGRAAELVAALTADLRPDTPEEYRRIPWVWRVAIAAGRRNDAGEVRRLLDAALPKAGEPLRDWQAVVVGGGVINGISLTGVWPRPRLVEVLNGDADLSRRWRQALPQAAGMADDEKVKPGTRYDALRMIALDTWERRGEQLARYLARGVNPELQMGAISGLADMDAPRVPALLLAGLDHFSAGNRKLALNALLRGDARAAALLDAIEQGRVKPSVLSAEQARALRGLKNEALRKRAVKLLPP